MVSIRLRGGREAALRVCAATEVFTLAESLGGVESLIEHPGPDDAHVGRGLGAAGARRPRAALGGDRGRRRPGGGPPQRARPGLQREHSAPLSVVTAPPAQTRVNHDREGAPCEIRHPLLAAAAGASVAAAALADVLDRGSHFSHLVPLALVAAIVVVGAREPHRLGARRIPDGRGRPRRAARAAPVGGVRRPGAHARSRLRAHDGQRRQHHRDAGAHLGPGGAHRGHVRPHRRRARPRHPQARGSPAPPVRRPRRHRSRAAAADRAAELLLGRAHRASRAACRPGIRNPCRHAHPRGHPCLRTPLPVAYLVTGGRGFIGRHLLARLAAQGAEVHATTRSATPPADPDVRWWRVDLADAAATEELVTRVCSPTSSSTSRPAPTAPAASTPSCRSSPTPCSPRSPSSPRPPGCRSARSSLAGSVEDGGHQPDVHSPYAASKAAAATYATLFHGLWQLDVTVLRLAMVYGPDDPNAHRLIPSVVAAFRRGPPPGGEQRHAPHRLGLRRRRRRRVPRRRGRPEPRRRLRHRVGHARVDPRHRPAGRGRDGHRDRPRVRRGGRPPAGARAARRPGARPRGPRLAAAGGPGRGHRPHGRRPYNPAAGRLLVSESEARGWAAETGGEVATRDTRRGRARAPGRRA